jgi:hypothetical protein
MFIEGEWRCDVVEKLTNTLLFNTMNYYYYYYYYYYYHSANYFSFVKSCYVLSICVQFIDLKFLLLRFEY